MRPRTSFSLALCLTMFTTTAFAKGQPQDNYFKTSDGVKIHYLVQGEGTPIILIHGYTGSTRATGSPTASPTPWPRTTWSWPLIAGITARATSRNSTAPAGRKT